MALCKHSRVLSALERRALRYRRKGQLDADEALYNEAIDETGTVATASFTDSDEELEGESSGATFITATATALEEEGIRGISHDLLNVHGVAPGAKPEGVSRFIYENIDGINTRISENEKLAKGKEVIDELEADVAAFTEPRINCAHKDNVNGLSQMFNGGNQRLERKLDGTRMRT